MIKEEVETDEQENAQNENRFTYNMFYLKQI
jgi:hypothetical protein